MAAVVEIVQVVVRGGGHGGLHGLRPPQGHPGRDIGGGRVVVGGDGGGGGGRECVGFLSNGVGGVGGSHG